MRDELDQGPRKLPCPVLVPVVDQEGPLIEVLVVAQDQAFPRLLPEVLLYPLQLVRPRG